MAAYTIKHADNQQIKCSSVGLMWFLEKIFRRIYLHISTNFRTFADQKKHKYYDTKNHTDQDLS